MKRKYLPLGLGLLLSACSSVSVKSIPQFTEPIVIAHRGASGHLPEHTLEGFKLAIEMGADFIEPDLVSTKDGVLIARHENEISGTTDVAEKFPSRKATKKIDGETLTGWFTEDFTLAEIKTLRARERLASRSQKSNGLFLIPTFAEIIALAKEEGEKRHRPVGIYPETKHPTYFAGIGLGLEKPLVAMLGAADLNRADAWVFVQSFETKNLRELKSLLKVPLVQLVGGPNEKPYDFVVSGDPRTYRDLMTPEGLNEIAGYSRGIGPNKEMLLHHGKDTGIVKAAHRAGLKVHPYAFRSDQPFLDQKYAGVPGKEYDEYFKLGVDGIFSDFPDAAYDARVHYLMQCH